MIILRELSSPKHSMKSLKFISTLFVLCSICMTLSACDGGGNGSPNPQTTSPSGPTGGGPIGGGGPSGGGGPLGGTGAPGKNTKKTPSNPVPQALRLKSTPIPPQSCPPGAEYNDCKKILAIADTLAEPLVVYRWGSKKFEDLRVQQNKVFDVVRYAPVTPVLGDTTLYSNGSGASLYGLGLYTAYTPADSKEYGDLLSMQDKYLINIVIPAGTKVIDENKHYYALQTAGINMGRIHAMVDLPIILKVSAAPYVVIKTNVGMVVESFSGKYLTTAEIFQFLKSMSTIGLSGTTSNYYHGQIAQTLSTRIYRPSRPQTIPIPDTAEFEVAKWPTLSPPLNAAYDPNVISYFWNYRGECNKYYDDGDVLVEIGIAEREFCVASGYDITNLKKNSDGTCTGEVDGEPLIQVHIDGDQCHALGGI